MFTFLEKLGLLHTENDLLHRNIRAEVTWA